MFAEKKTWKIISDRTRKYQPTLDLGVRGGGQGGNCHLKFWKGPDSGK